MSRLIVETEIVFEGEEKMLTLFQGHGDKDMVTIKIEGEEIGGIDVTNNMREFFEDALRVFEDVEENRVE